MGRWCRHPLSSNWLRDPDAAAFDSDHRARSHVLTVATKYVHDQRNALRGWHIRKAKQPRVACTAVDKSSEICVDGHQDPSLLCCHLKDHLVARVRTEPGHLDHVVPFRPEPLGQTMTRTSIDEEFHLAS